MTTNSNIFSEINLHLLEDEQPSLFFNQFSKLPLFNQYPLKLLNNLKQTNQSPKHHPEGNVWNHTMLVLDEAAKVKDKSQNKKVFMWAALLHDICTFPLDVFQRFFYFMIHSSIYTNTSHICIINIVYTVI